MADRNRDADAKELLAAADRINANLNRAEGVTKRAEKAAERAEGVVARAEGLARRVGSKPPEYIAPTSGLRRNFAGQPIFEREGATRPPRPTPPPAPLRPSIAPPQGTTAQALRSEIQNEREIERLRTERDRIQTRADRAAQRLFAGEVKSASYAKRLANQLERVQGDLDRAEATRQRPAFGTAQQGEYDRMRAAGVNTLQARHPGWNPNVQYIPTSDLARFQAHDRTPEGPEAGRTRAQYDHLKAQILREGIQVPLELKYDQKRGLAQLGQGNHRLTIARELGIQEIPVRLRLAQLTEGVTPPVQPSERLRQTQKFYKPSVIGLGGTEEPTRPPRALIEGGGLADAKIIRGREDILADIRRQKQILDLRTDLKRPERSLPGKELKRFQDELTAFDEASARRAAIEKREQAERTAAAQAGARARITADQRTRIIDPGASRNRLYPADAGTAPPAARFLGYPGGPDPRDRRRPIDTTGGASTELVRLNELREQGIKLTAEQTAAQLRYMAILREQVALAERLNAIDRRRALPPSSFIEGTARDETPPRPPRQLPPGYVPPESRQLPPGRQPQLQLPAAGGTVGGSLYGSSFPTGIGAGGRGQAVPNPARVRAYYSELQRAALIQQDASQQMRRHGALTTEFLTALARGETTLAEFRYQIGATIGKFAGWTAAATAVYGVVGALRTLGTGAIDGLSAVQDLSRFVTTGFDRDEATTRIGDLSRKYNVSPGTTGEASIGVAKVYKDQDTSLKATEVVLKAVQVAELDAADATKYFAAIGRGASLDIGQLAQVLDEVNSAQNNIGVSSSDMIAGLARATPAFIQAGGSVQTLTELMATLQAITGESGTTIGTALARTVSRVRRPSNQAVLKEFGIDPKQGIDQIFEQAIAKSPNLTGQQRVRLGGQGLSSPEYGRFFTGLLGDSGRAAFAKAQKFTDPNVARGSADRELAIRLGSVREQLKRLGVELQVIGLQLAQSGIGDLLAVGIAALTKTLQAINEVLKLFNELPTGVKKTAVYLAELAAVLALLRRTGVGQALSERYGLSNLGRSPEELARRKAITTTRSVAESLVSQRESYANEAVQNRVKAASEYDRGEALIRAGAPKSEVDEARASAKAYVKAGAAAAEREEILGESVKRNEQILKGLQKRRLTAAEAGTAYLPGGPPGSGQRPVKYLPDAAPEPARSVRPRTGPTPLIAPLAPVVSTREPGRVGGAATGAFNALNKVAGAMPALSVAILGGGALFLAGSKILGAIKADKAKREALTTPGSSLDEERRRQALAREVIRERPAPAPKGVRVEDYKDEATETRRQDRARQRRIGAQRIEGLAPWDLYLEEVGEQAKLDANESKSAAELKKKIQLRKTEARRSIQAQSGLAKDREEVQRVLARLDEIYRRSLVAAEGRGALATFRDSSADEITTGVGLLQARIEAKPNASQAAPIRGLSAAYLSAAERFRNSEDPKELAVVESSRKALVDAVTQVDRKLQLSLKVATTSAQRQSAYRTARSELSNRRRLFEHAADQTRRRFFAVGKDLAATQKELDALPAAGGLAQGDELLYSSPITGGADSLRRQLKARIDRLKKKRADLIARGIADGKALDDANAELDAFDQDYKIAQFDERTSDRQRTADLKKSTSTNEKANAQEDIKAAQGNYNDAKRTFGPKSDRAIDALIALNNLVTQVNEDVSKEAADFAAKVQARGDLRTSTINPNTAAGGVARIGSQLQTAKEVLATLQEHGAKQEEINQQIAQVNDLQFSMQEAAKQLAERLSQAKFRQQVAGILDPVRRAKAQLRYDRSQLKGKTGVEREEQKATVREDEVALRQAIIDEDLSDARFKHDVGKLTDKAYINELKKILRTKKLGKQARQSILTEIYNLQHEEEGGELSLTPGGAHLPTLTEIRKFIGGGDIGKATQGGSPTVVDSRQQKTTNTFHVMINTPDGWQKFSDLLEQAGVRSIKTAARSRRPG